MRILSMITGVLLAAVGILSIANEGLSFISMAFPIGVVLILVGLVECFSYKKAIENEEGKHWLLIEGLTTFILGVVVLSGHLSADVAVPIVFGMWVMVSGIRGFVVLMQMMEDKEEKDIDFYWNFMVSGLNLIIGIYTFYNSATFQFSVLMILGLCFVVQGANIIKIGWDIKYVKPEIIKTKDEKIAEAAEAVEEAHKEVKKAIRKARRAKRRAQKAEEAKEYQEIVAEPVREVSETDEESDEEEPLNEALYQKEQ